FFQAEDGIRDLYVTGVQTCALPIFWVSYLTSRMNFYLDLEQMTLDDRGVWCDELFNRTDGQTRVPDRQPGERLRAPRPLDDGRRSEERRVGKECRSGCGTVVGMKGG